MLSLNDIRELKNSQIYNDNNKNIKFSGVSIDTRTIKRSELFFAIKGEKKDGHEYLKELTGKIKAAVVNSSWLRSVNTRSVFKGIVLISVDDTTTALGDLAGIYRRKFQIPVIAVAGSNGKTTTRDIIVQVLSEKYKVLTTHGNQNNQFGVPLTLFKLDKEHEICVIEIGTNHFGEINRLCNICEPQYGLITNIAKEHLEFFVDLKGVLREEASLINYLKKRFGTFFLNKDDKLLLRKASGFEKTFSFGMDSNNDVKAKLIRFKGFYPFIEIKYKAKKIKFQSSMIGLPAFYSSVCAAAVGFYFRVPVNKIKKALSDFRIKTHGRNELKRCGSFWLIDDSYNSNPDSVIAALENLKCFKAEKNSHIVLSDMLELGKASKKEHFMIGKKIKKYGFSNLYTYGCESIETFKAANGIKVNMYFNNKKTLTEVLDRMIKKDDIVLIKGSHGMGMNMIVDYLKIN